MRAVAPLRGVPSCARMTNSARVGERRDPSVSRLALGFGALGVVFGDIGTSPLYAVQTVFSRDVARPVPVDADAVYGVISLIFWAVVIVVTLKYVVFIMRADNDGEGGIMALIALVLGRAKRAHMPSLVALVALGIFGASLFFGDSMITPAISVLSAVEGLEVVEPSLEHLVVPIAAAILIGLFALQSRGTAHVGRLFGPVMLVWFSVLAVLGVHGIADHPGILQALSPHYGAQFFAEDGLTAFLALGGVVLAITGAEALYADMGHFGRGPIRGAWLLAVFPALTLNYLGQGALILEHPDGAVNPFYLLVPHWARVPMIFLACAATVIASQAVISGAFSVTRQAVQLGYLPRLRILHTSHQTAGQVYVPFINWALLAAVLILVFAFERSSRLASAYGIAVTGTITITLTLFLVLMRLEGRWRIWHIALAAAVFGTVDLAFLSANLDKLITGGWLPIVTGIGVYTVLSTWRRGRIIVTRNREREEGSLAGFVELLQICQPPVKRVPGTAVFLNRGTTTTPLAMRENVDHNHTLHETAVILSIETAPVPFVPDEERVAVSDLAYRDDGISLVVARYGFQQQPDVPAVLRQAAAKLESAVDLNDVTYFLSKIEIVQSNTPDMPAWRKRLFLATAHLAADAVDYFQLPRHHTVLLGSAIEI
jgi:KUP system potassium uptake protein